MFTGLIEAVGTVHAVERGSNEYRLHIRSPLADRLQEGDSVAVNGICLTAKRCLPGEFVADVMPETVARAELGTWRSGKQVNLERALSVSARLDGHLVSGHVDGTGRIQAIRRDRNAVRITVAAEATLMAGLIPKGSVALDGISLTVIACTAGIFSVGVIPHTYAHTALQAADVGTVVNIETDMIGKYVFAWLERQPAETMPSSLHAVLRANGYWK